MFKQLLFLVISIGILHSSNGTKLRGCYVESEPFMFSNPESGYLEGYSIDVINKVAEIVGFEYQLYKSPDGSYGIHKDGKWTGMIGEVVKQAADFAISDITVTSEREEVIDFTEPIFNLSIAAVVLKSHKGNIQSLKDLAAQTSVKYGALSGGSTMHLFQKARNPTLRNMYSYMNKHPDVLVKSTREGLTRVLREQYAFIGESATLEYLADNNCDLAVIHGDEFDDEMRRQYAIVLQEGSRYNEAFNRAIRKLRDDGTLKQLKHKYWNKHCLSSYSVSSLSKKLFSYFSDIIYNYLGWNWSK